MKKLAKLTALLLTGVMLLLLASCGAAPNPLTPEQQAKQQILAALNKYRTSNGAKEVDEIPELSAAEQLWVDTFRKAGDYKISNSEARSVFLEYQGMRPSEWVQGSESYLGWESTPTYDYFWLEDTDPSDATRLMQRFATKSGIKSDKNTAVGIGVTTINGKIYWACTLYEPKT